MIKAQAYMYFLYVLFKLTKKEQRHHIDVYFYSFFPIKNLEYCKRAVISATQACGRKRADKPLCLYCVSLRIKLQKRLTHLMP